MDGQNWLGMAELAVALIGIVLAAYFYNKSRHKVALFYTIQQTQLLGRSPVLSQDVSILYRGKEIPNLVKSNCIFWNSGNVPIKHDDIVAGSPITITLSDKSQLLKASVLKYSLPQNGVVINAVSANDNMTKVDFVYLEPRHGFNIELLHAGEILYPTLSGTVIGMPRGFRRFNSEAATNKEAVVVAMTIVASGLITASIYVLIVKRYDIFLGPAPATDFFGMLLLLFLVLGMIGGTFLGVILLKNYRRGRLPQALYT